jgi:two-component sensor histidine kinase
LSSALRVLLVEDNPGDARLLREAVADASGSVSPTPAGAGVVSTHAAPPMEWTQAARLDEALQRLRERPFDLVLLDLSLPDAHGFDTFARVCEAAPDVPVVVLTGLDDEDLALRTVHAGAQDYLVKGEFDGRLLVRAMRYAVERGRVTRALREKSEQLKLSIREAHHRIKNNLQAISDLLYLELTSADGAPPEEALRDSMHRVQAIAAVHDLLSQDEDVRVVDARPVIDRLVPMVLHSSGIPQDNVAVRTDVAMVPLSSKRATALALIINELVSNAAKHAFRDGRQGALAVSLRQENEELVLRVQDNGPGLPAEFNLDTDSHVGLDVVRILAERDLDGTLKLWNNGGLTVEMRFVW